ncbi:MAG TPA: aldo/keto reductase [Pontiella sp.]
MLPTAPFGRTGHDSSRIIFGAAAFWALPQADADRTLDLILESGINHIDTAADYHESEEHVGAWLKHHRNRFFLASKTSQRSYAGAKTDLYRSLDRLQTDHLDLWQMHCLVDEQDWQTAMAPGGALEALREAKEEGLVKHLGVTGHGSSAPAMHLKSLAHFDFDSVLLPYNYAQMTVTSYASDLKKLLATCLERNVAVQTIKAISRGPLGGGKKNYTMWYAPLEDQEAIDHAVQWVLGNPQVFLNSAADINLLPKIIKSAKMPIERPAQRVMNADLKNFGITPLFTTPGSELPT